LKKTGQNDALWRYARSEEFRVLEGESQRDQRNDIAVLTQTRHLSGGVGAEPRLERLRRSACGVRGGLGVREVHLNEGPVGLDQGVRYGEALAG